MKNLKHVLLAFVFLLLFSPVYKSLAQGKKQAYTYVTLPNDPLKARIYTLGNGLTVYMTVYKDAPRIQTFIAVKAGSKTDPADATGLAHYLEHMLFKGTDKYGTKDFSKEKPELDKIVDLYEIYRATKDDGERKKIYHQIDSISGVAAHYAIANEYDKMMSAIGAKGTNAYTWVEQTVYVNDIPSNQMEKWLTIESERFRNPVMRIFHTELEAVYEEKNRGLDNDGEKSFEALMAGLWQKHSYGTQTTIGTIDHLKNPSIKKIKEYLAKYYVPNNMAICLSGDFDMDATIKLIDEKFGALPSKPVTAFVPPVEDPISSPVIKEVFGPEAATMMMGWRFGGASTHDADMVTVIDKLLGNGTAGLIDLDLNQKQQVLNGSSQTLIFKDYSAHILGADPREGQTLEQVRDLLLAEVDKLKKGDFPDDLLKAIITDMKLQQTKSYERNSGRANAFVEAAVLGLDWKDCIAKIDRLSKITKQEIVAYVNKNYNNNYVIVYKRTGEDKNVKKVDKPAITPVEVNRESKSPFVQAIIDGKTPDIQPVFIDYNKDIKHLTLKNGIKVNYKVNTENNLFDLYYLVEMGKDNDKKLDLALGYLSYLGTSKYTPAAIQQEFYKLGCSFSVQADDDQAWVSLTGLTENFNAAVQLFESLLADPQPNKEAYVNMVKDIIKHRNDGKLDKNTILWSGMYNYGVYGKKSSFTDILSEEQLNSIKPEELISEIKNLTSYQHHVLYYGPSDTTTLLANLNKLHMVPAQLKPVPPAAKYEQLPTETNQVFVVNYDMKQAEIIMLSKGTQYNKQNAPSIAAYNEYFGGGMSSIVFQDMRESKALAYSVFSSYQNPQRKEKAHYNMAYIGTQADKLPEAMAGMTALLTNMPESQNGFNAAQEAVLKKIQTERITKAQILFNYERAQKMGLDYDIRQDVFKKMPGMKLDDVKAFQNKFVKGDKYTIMVLGDKSKLDIPTLEKYGKVTFLNLTDIFGF